MGQPPHPPDTQNHDEENSVNELNYDGCARTCRVRGAHTLRFGSCEHAPDPEGAVTFLRPFTAADGQPALGTMTLTVGDLARDLELILRAYNCPDPMRVALAAAGHLARIGGTR